MIAAAVFVFNFLVNLRLKQINLPVYPSSFLSKMCEWAVGAK